MPRKVWWFWHPWFYVFGWWFCQKEEGFTSSLTLLRAPVRRQRGNNNSGCSFFLLFHRVSGPLLLLRPHHWCHATAEVQCFCLFRQTQNPIRQSHKCQLVLRSLHLFQCRRSWFTPILDLHRLRFQSFQWLFPCPFNHWQVSCQEKSKSSNVGRRCFCFNSPFVVLF